MEILHLQVSKKTSFYCEDGWTLKQVAQRHCRVFIDGGIQNLTGHGHEQQGLTNPTWAGPGVNVLLGDFCDSVILNFILFHFCWFCSCCLSNNIHKCIYCSRLLYSIYFYFVFRVLPFHMSLGKKTWFHPDLSPPSLFLSLCVPTAFSCLLIVFSNMSSQITEQYMLFCSLNS